MINLLIYPFIYEWKYFLNSYPGA